MKLSDYFDLGNHTMPVTTNSAEAQLWFDRGLLWTYGYNHEEAVRCFQMAANADPGCAMAYWGQPNSAHIADADRARWLLRRVYWLKSSVGMGSDMWPGFRMASDGVFRTVFPPP